MAQRKEEAAVANIINNDLPTQPIKLKVMRKNDKVARVSCYCKLNMLVPHLQSLSSRMQAEAKHTKNRTGNTPNQ
jgi:hypothetical protein